MSYAAASAVRFREVCRMATPVQRVLERVADHWLAEKLYRRRPLDLLRMWQDKIEVWMLEQAGIDVQAEKSA